MAIDSKPIPTQVTQYTDAEALIQAQVKTAYMFAMARLFAH